MFPDIVKDICSKSSLKYSSINLELVLGPSASSVSGEPPYFDSCVKKEKSRSVDPIDVENLVLSPFLSYVL